MVKRGEDSDIASSIPNSKTLQVGSIRALWGMGRGGMEYGEVWHIVVGGEVWSIVGGGGMVYFGGRGRHMHFGWTQSDVMNYND